MEGEGRAGMKKYEKTGIEVPILLALYRESVFNDDKTFYPCAMIDSELIKTGRSAFRGDTIMTGV